MNEIYEASQIEYPVQKPKTKLRLAELILIHDNKSVYCIVYSVYV